MSKLFNYELALAFVKRFLKVLDCPGSNLACNLIELVRVVHPFHLNRIYAEFSHLLPPIHAHHHLCSFILLEPLRFLSVLCPSTYQVHSGQCHKVFAFSNSVTLQLTVMFFVLIWLFSACSWFLCCWFLIASRDWFLSLSDSRIFCFQIWKDCLWQIIKRTQKQLPNPYLCYPRAFSSLPTPSRTHRIDSSPQSNPPTFYRKAHPLSTFALGSSSKSTFSPTPSPAST